MPVSIASSLLLWSALLLPGAKAEPTQPQPRRAELVVCEPTISATIQSWPLDRSADWTISEADLEEEDSSDGGDDFVVYKERWNSLQTGLSDQALILRLGRSAFCPSLRSPILRC